jgi:TonB family protein
MNVPTRLLPAIALLGLATLAAPVHAAPEVINDSNGCGFANPFPKPNEQVSWTGACVDGWGSGEGTLQWIVEGVTRTSYVGTLAEGRPEGHGVLTWNGGDRYEGRFVAGRHPGPGVFTTAAGERFEDRFERDDMSGRGTVALPDGTRLEGRFRAGALADGGVLVRRGAAGEQRLPVDVAERALPDVPAVAASAPGAPKAVVGQPCRRIAYPPVALRQHATGQSRLALLVDPDGSVRRVRIVAPSGADLAHQVLDVTAIETALACPITAGTVDGHPAPRWMSLEFEWRLE